MKTIALAYKQEENYAFPKWKIIHYFFFLNWFVDTEKGKREPDTEDHKNKYEIKHYI